ncbi:hypothetical protein MAPG_02377 [Magnaporthiopsis poae ATCC 64411]|uniref:Uncharacterized protein n=1 Tax=Magnaporthiopsis poae (strain ATCC 64411 / 73-15) TaxID=644358 RepID=A0A0C4DR73_MAGP6|nr:hypothetical protein MAPG_02377 [Magnaporthiopsis poae ATCC 64411]
MRTTSDIIGSEYHYNFPNNKIEQERENLKHTVDKLLCGMLYYDPIGDSPQRILHVRTSTRIWAIESQEFWSKPLVTFEMQESIHYPYSSDETTTPAKDHPFAQLLRLTDSSLGAMGINFIHPG